MSSDLNRDTPPMSTPDAGEDNLSVQVQTGATSNRSKGTPNLSRSSSRECSPSTTSRAISRVQTTNNSQSSAVSPGQDQPSAEHLLIDLITPTETSNKGLTDALHGLKRHHDGESHDEPRSKRDKLGDELEELHATFLGGKPGSEDAAVSGVEDGKGSGKPDDHTRAGPGKPSKPTAAIPLRGGPPRQASRAVRAADVGDAGVADSTMASNKPSGGKYDDSGA